MRCGLGRCVPLQEFATSVVACRRYVRRSLRASGHPRVADPRKPTTAACWTTGRPSSGSAAREKEEWRKGGVSLGKLLGWAAAHRTKCRWYGGRGLQHRAIDCSALPLYLALDVSHEVRRHALDRDCLASYFRDDLHIQYRWRTETASYAGEHNSGG